MKLVESVVRHNQKNKAIGIKYYDLDSVLMNVLKRFPSFCSYTLPVLINDTKTDFKQDSIDIKFRTHVD